jgi:hypothetical protein
MRPCCCCLCGHLRHEVSVGQGEVAALLLNVTAMLSVMGSEGADVRHALGAVQAELVVVKEELAAARAGLRNTVHPTRRPRWTLVCQSSADDCDGDAAVTCGRSVSAGNHGLARFRPVACGDSRVARLGVGSAGLGVADRQCLPLRPGLWGRALGTPGYHPVRGGAVGPLAQLLWGAAHLPLVGQPVPPRPGCSYCAGHPVQLWTSSVGEEVVLGDWPSTLSGPPTPAALMWTWSPVPLSEEAEPPAPRSRLGSMLGDVLNVMGGRS